MYVVTVTEAECANNAEYSREDSSNHVGAKKPENGGFFFVPSSSVKISCGSENINYVDVLCCPA